MTTISIVKQTSRVFFYLLISIAVISFTSCGSDDSDPDPDPTDCVGVTKLGGEMIVNNETFDLTIAQASINSPGGGFDDIYTFQIAGISNDCNSIRTINLTVERAVGSSISGTYSIEKFFDAGVDDAYGSYATQVISPISQTLSDMVSGSVTISDGGTKLYTMDLDATTIGGESVTLSLTHQF